MQAAHLTSHNFYETSEIVCALSNASHSFLPPIFIHYWGLPHAVRTVAMMSLPTVNCNWVLMRELLFSSLGIFFASESNGSKALMHVHRTCFQWCDSEKENHTEVTNFFSCKPIIPALFKVLSCPHELQFDRSRLYTCVMTVPLVLKRIDAQVQ